MNYYVFTHTAQGFDFPAGLRSTDTIPDYIRTICHSTEGRERPMFLRYLPLPGEGGYLALGIPSHTQEAQSRRSITIFNYCLNQEECQTLFSDAALDFLNQLLRDGLPENTRKAYQSDPTAFWNDICQLKNRRPGKITLKDMDRSILYSVLLNAWDVPHLILSHTPEQYPPDGSEALFRVLQWLPAPLRPNALSFHTDLRSKEEMDPYTRLVLVSDPSVVVNRTVSHATASSGYTPQGLEQYSGQIDRLMELSSSQGKQILSLLAKPEPPEPRTPPQESPMIQPPRSPSRKSPASSPPIPETPPEQPSALAMLFQMTMKVLGSLVLVFLTFLAAQSLWDRSWLEALIGQIQEPQRVLLWMFTILLALVVLLLALLSVLVCVLLFRKKPNRRK